MANKVDTVYRKALEEAKALDIESGDVRWLIMEAEGYHSPADVIYYRDKEMRHEDLFWSYWEKRKSGLPVQYVTGKAPFLGFDLFVDQRVLIPRQETEEMLATLSERIYDYYDPRNYLVAADIGTGSGCIALGLKNFFPNWLVTASDISKGALEVAKTNFAKYDVSVNVLEGDALEPYIAQNMALDIIVSNPPYVKSRAEAEDIVRNNEPASALYIGDGLSVYQKIFRDYKKVKKGSLLMVFEIDPWLVDNLKRWMEENLQDYEADFVNDLRGMPRFLFVYLH